MVSAAIVKLVARAVLQDLPRAGPGIGAFINFRVRPDLLGRGSGSARTCPGGLRPPRHVRADPEPLPSRSERARISTKPWARHGGGPAKRDAPPTEQRGSPTHSHGQLRGHRPRGSSSLLPRLIAVSGGTHPTCFSRCPAILVPSVRQPEPSAEEHSKHSSKRSTPKHNKPRAEPGNDNPGLPTTQ